MKRNSRRFTFKNEFHSYVPISSKLFQGEKKVRTPKSKTTKSALTTPIMEIDEDDEDIKLKTPPHVRKIKSRPNSAAGTPKGSRNNTPMNPKTNLAKLEKMLDASSKKLKKKKSKIETPKKTE